MNGLSVSLPFSWADSQLWNGWAILRLSVLRTCQPFPPSCCVILRSRQQCTGVLISPHPHQHCCFLPFCRGAGWALQAGPILDCPCSPQKCWFRWNQHILEPPRPRGMRHPASGRSLRSCGHLGCSALTGFLRWHSAPGRQDLQSQQLKGYRPNTKAAGIFLLHRDKGKLKVVSLWLCCGEEAWL